MQVEAVSDSDAEIGTVDVSRIALDPEQEATGKRKSLQNELEGLVRDRARHERVRVDAQFRRATLERLTGGYAAVPFASGNKPAISPEQIGNLLLLTNRELSEISSVFEKTLPSSGVIKCTASRVRRIIQFYGVAARLILIND